METKKNQMINKIFGFFFEQYWTNVQYWKISS